MTGAANSAVAARRIRPFVRIGNARPVHPDETPTDRSVRADGCVDASSLTIEIQIKRTDDDASLDDWKWKIFVGEQARHGRLRAFVVADLLADLVVVSTHIGPGTGQILGA